MPNFGQLSFDVECDFGQEEAVAAEVVANDPEIAVFSKRRVAPNRWVFVVTNLDRQNPHSVTVELKCVRLGPGRATVFREARTSLGSFERAVRDLLSPRGHAPVGTGFSHFPPGGQPGDPPPDNAFVRTVDDAFVRGGFRTVLQNTGSAPVEVQLGYVSVDRSRRARGRTVRTRVTRRSTPADAPPGATSRVDGRCPRGSVAIGLGFDAPDDKSVFVDPLGWTGPRGFHFAILNLESTTQQVTLQPLCLQIFPR